MAEKMQGGKKLKIGKHFGEGTKVSGGLAGHGTGLGRKGKPYGHEHRQTEGHLNPAKLEFAGNAPPGHKRKKK